MKNGWGRQKSYFSNTVSVKKLLRQDNIKSEKSTFKWQSLQTYINHQIWSTEGIKIPILLYNFQYYNISCNLHNKSSLQDLILKLSLFLIQVCVLYNSVYQPVRWAAERVGCQTYLILFQTIISFTIIINFIKNQTF